MATIDKIEVNGIVYDLASGDVSQLYQIPLAVTPNEIYVPDDRNYYYCRGSDAVKKQSQSANCVVYYLKETITCKKQFLNDGGVNYCWHIPFAFLETVIPLNPVIEMPIIWHEQFKRGDVNGTLKLFWEGTQVESTVQFTIDCQGILDSTSNADYYAYLTLGCQFFLAGSEWYARLFCSAE